MRNGKGLWLPLLLVVAGCETAGQDFSDFAAGLAPKTPSQAARMAVNPNDPDDRREGIVLLSNAPFGGVDIYIDLYRDYAENASDPLVRAAAVRALARHGTPSDASTIADNLQHENQQVRWEAAKGLQRVHNSVAIPAMLKVLRDEEEVSDIREAIAVGLGQYPEDRVVHALIASLDARELAVNLASRLSLVTLTGYDFQMDSARWLTWYNTALDGGDPFLGRQEYLYPTFTRDETLLENLMFWSSRNFEYPAPPAGLRPESERSTYESEDEEPVTEQQ